MTRAVVSVGEAEPVTAAARLLQRCNCGAVPVCDRSGRLRGIVTDRDIALRCVAGELDPAHTPVSEIMSRRVVTVSAAAPVSEAALRMRSEAVRRVPVTENDRLVGMLSLGDMARLRELRGEAGETLRALSVNLRR